MRRMSEPGSAQVASASQNLVTLAVMILVGFLALVSLYMGFQAYGSGHPEDGVLYMVIGAAGFAAIGYTFFRSKAVTQEKLKVSEVEVVTTLECPQCNLKRVRAFKRGDYFFKDDESCTRCEGSMLVTAIHQRKEENRKRRR